MLAFAHSYYSLRYGTLSPEDLVAQAVAHGYKALVLTDINNTAGVFPFIKACHEKGLQPLIGIQFRRNNLLLYTGVALNQQGFRELNTFLSKYLLQHQPLPDLPPAFAQAVIIYPFAAAKKPSLRDNEYIGVAPTEINQLLFSDLRQYPDKLIMQPVFSCQNEDELTLHRHLRAIDNNILLSQLNAGHGIATD